MYLFILLINLFTNGLQHSRNSVEISVVQYLLVRASVTNLRKRKKKKKSVDWTYSSSSHWTLNERKRKKEWRKKDRVEEKKKKDCPRFSPFI